MMHVHITPKDEAALWHCDNCGAWWCSQPVREATAFMLSLPAETLENLGWDNFRGWRLGGVPHVATCPDCRTVQDAPHFGYAAVRPQLTMSLADLLQPTPA